MSFRKDFIWGAATASYQVEGAAFEDGKGRSIWDDFSHTQGKVYNGQTGDVSCDHYHRMREDVALMERLGIRNYRFSIAWARVLPQGEGEVNEAGLRFYDDLIDCLLAHGIRPMVTLYHWDLPSALQHQGGWRNPKSPQWFEAYTALVAKRYGDRVQDFFTFNEPQCVIGIGNIEGNMAPGWQPRYSGNWCRERASAWWVAAWWLCPRAIRRKILKPPGRRTSPTRRPTPRHGR